MTRRFLIDAFLINQSSKNVFNLLIDKAILKGFVFINFLVPELEREKNNPEKLLLSKKEIMEILLGFKNKYGHTLLSNFQDTTFGIKVLKFNDRFVRIGWNTLQSSWQKFFPKNPGYQEEEYTFVMDDVARQSRLLLDLVDSFILEGFSIGEVDAEYAKEIPEKTLMSKILREVSFEDMAAMLTKNLLYNRCIMLKSLENSNVYGISEFENELLRNLHSQTDFHFYIRRDNFFKKLIYSVEQLLFIPLDPIRKKRFNNEEHIDLAFYVRLLIGLCEDFPILELRTNFWRE